MTFTPRRIQRRRTKGWRIPPGAVNVCRPTDWGNPYRVGDRVLYSTGIALGPPHAVTITPALAVALFIAYVQERGWEDQIRRELRGKDLVCWCKPDAPCHANYLLHLANTPPVTMPTRGVFA